MIAMRAFRANHNLIGVARPAGEPNPFPSEPQFADDPTNAPRSAHTGHEQPSPPRRPGQAGADDGVGRPYGVPAWSLSAWTCAFAASDAAAAPRALPIASIGANGVCERCGGAGRGGAGWPMISQAETSSALSTTRTISERDA